MYQKHIFNINNLTSKKMKMKINNNCVLQPCFKIELCMCIKLFKKSRIEIRFAPTWMWVQMNCIMTPAMITSGNPVVVNLPGTLGPILGLHSTLWAILNRRSGHVGPDREELYIKCFSVSETFLLYYQQTDLFNFPFSVQKDILWNYQN